MSPQIFKTGLIMLIISGILFSAVGQLRLIIIEKKKKGIFYIFCTILVFGGVAVISFNSSFASESFTKYIAMQVIFVVLGVLHIWALTKLFKWPEDNTFTYQFIFTVAITLVGSFSFTWVLGKFGDEGYFELFIPSVIGVIIPFMIWQTFLHAGSIPGKVYNQWHYPRKRLPDPDRDELMNPQVISLYFQKSQRAIEVTHFRVKAPEQMNFGVFFYHFINDYNTSHPESTIEYDNTGKEGWIFYKKPGFLQIRKHIDPEFTVARNKVRENNIIICERV